MMGRSGIDNACLWILAACASAWPLPNIVYILADDLGIGDVTGYNPASKVSTPSMDRILREGMRFTDAHSGSSVCSPTRYGILTGRYAWRTSLKSGVLGTLSPALIDADRLTVAGMLRQQGYKTAVVGKWHLGLDWKDPADWGKGFSNGPTAHGFDYFYGIPASLDMSDYAYLENDRVVEAPTDSIAGSDWPAYWRAGHIAPRFRHVEVLPAMAEKAAAWVRAQHQSAPGQPFFLYLALPAPHAPHVPGAAYLGKSAAGVRGDYVAATDGAIGRFRAALDSLGLTANTVLVLASDNGAHDRTYKQNGHTPHMGWKGQKADIYEAGHRIPFAVAWPGVVAAGSVATGTVCLTDFLATAAAIVSYRLPAAAGEDSYSLLPMLLGRSPAAPLREATVHHSSGGTFAIRQGPWKLTVDNLGSGGYTDPVTAAGLGTLYNLDSNAAENAAQNRYAARPVMVQNLRDLLAKYKAEGRSAPLPRRDEFWSGTTGARAAAPGAARSEGLGKRFVFTAKAAGPYTARLSDMLGHTLWTGSGIAQKDGEIPFPADLRSGGRLAEVAGPGWRVGWRW